MGHPLISPEQKVRNDYRIDRLGEVHIITGSNMAGKSSFLRTAGINLCLAYAGGAVDALELQTSLFRLFTAIRVTDSVTDGISYFYAEVKRLKALLLELQRKDARPLFFLIDEIFRGTNNRERLIGSRAYIRALVGENGLGLIATHDLELVQLAQEMPQVSNFHFRDAIEDGRMVFDYLLRPGPSPTTNALKVMAEEGLPVPPDAKFARP
jgi:DNA mismatch repair ATPase MutS